MKINYFLPLILLVISSLLGCEATSSSQGTHTNGANPTELSQNSVELPAGTQLVVGFYNVENLFDTKDNPKTADEDFLPEGRYNWTEEKLEIKLANLAKVIGQLGDNGPDFLGLAELENRSVAERLASHELIRNKGYELVHDESPDERGIDVAFLYDPEKMNYEGYEALEVVKKGDQNFKTREILMVKGNINGQQMYFFVNHWPSRREGKEESEPNRVAAANRVKSKIEEILKEDSEAGFVVMGDFNDDPFDKSITRVLGAVGSKEKLNEDQLYNPMSPIFDPENYGSLTYRGRWNLFDQIIISEDLLDGEHSLSYLPNSAKVFNSEMIRVPNRNTKFVPRRAIFKGKFQDNGFSDHFPVYLTLYVN
ncbi:MAG: hypothetical protein MRZ79_26275 [Bacteroidia bacterium]|nr:hypothetical protein [Bacteroidia bacterium]